MTDTNYTYAVARIRSLEVALFSNATIDQLMACRTYEECLQFVVDKGWGDADTAVDADAILNREEEKIWEVMRQMRVDMSVFDVLMFPNQFHNLKAAIKEVCTEVDNPGIFYDDSEMDGAKMLEIIRNKDYLKLPQNMQGPAKEAYESLLHTRDGQLCDVIIDRATMEAIYAAGQQAKDDIIKNYAEDVVAIANIKIAVRSAKTAKSMEFMKRAMAECSSLNIEQLSQAALSGEEAIAEYLLGTAYAGGAEALKESTSAFERWCDNRVIQTIQPQKYKAFTIGPLVAYVLARQNEIKTVRIILSGKQNAFPDEAIRERVREMYV